jgi:hypothetical protein
MYLKWLFLFAFIILHNTHGKEIHVNSGEIMIVAPPDAITSPGAGAKILVHDTWIAVKESPKDVIEKIKD